MSIHFFGARLVIEGGNFFAIDMTDASTDDNTFIFVDGRGISIVVRHAIIKGS
jgi:hypothetical protein